MSKQENKRPLPRLFGVLLLNLTAFGVSIPVVPALAKELGAGGVEIGLIFGLQALGQFLMAPLWGSLSDKVGRKPILMVTILGAILVDVWTGLSGALWMLALARFVAGLCAGNVATASALITDATDAKTRSKGMAIIGISFGLGFTMGPAIGAIASMGAGAGLGLAGKGFPFAVAAGINVVALIMAGALLIEPVGAIEQRRLNRQRRRPDSLLKMLKRVKLQQLAVLFLAYSVAITIMETTFFLYAADRYGYNEAQVGMIFAGMGLLAAFVQGGVGKLSARFGDVRLIRWGIILLVVGLAAVPLWEVIGALLVALGVASVGRALLQPSSLAVLSGQAQDEGESGKVMGLGQSAQSAGRIIGPALGGLCFDLIDPRAPFIASALCLGLGGCWWVWVWGRAESKQSD